MKILAKKFSLMHFLIVLLHIPVAWGLTINNNEIRDLESNTTYFETESKIWDISQALTSANASQCAGTWLLGGYGMTGLGGTYTRKYQSLPAHNTIYFSADVWIIDLQGTKNLFEIYFDNVLFNSYSSGTLLPSSSLASDICGTAKTDFPFITIGGTVVGHTSLELTIKIVSLSNSASDKFYIGLRNLNLLFQTTPSSVSYACNFASSSSSASPSCLCSKGFYDPLGSNGCTSCNSSCQTCSGPSALNCTSCQPGYSFDGQICFKCDNTCNQCKGTAPTDCVRCSAGHYLYWNGTCLPSCNSPLVTRTEGEYLFCDLPCSNSTDYFYQNNTCQSNCLTPFTQSIVGDLKYCNFSCGTSEFLYWNGSCLPTCPLSLQTINGFERYCSFYCTAPNQYSYQNGSCLSSCPSPFITNSTVPGLTFCQLPCLTNEYYVLATNTCAVGCPYSTIAKQDGSFKYCAKNVSSPSPPSGDMGTYIGETGKDITEGIATAASILRSNTLGAAFKTSIVKLVKYIKYIQVPLDEGVRDILDSNVSAIYSVSTSFYYPMPESLQEQFEKHSIPPIFEEQGNHSSYLINNWNSMTTFFILFMLGLGSLIIEKLIRKFGNRTASLIMDRIRTISHWNFLLCIVFNTYDDLTLFAILEFVHVELNSLASVISFLTCIFMSLLSLYLLFMVLKINREALKIKSQVADTNTSNPEILFYRKWKHYQVTYAGYHDTSFISQGYLFWFTLRVIVTYIIVGLMHTSPLAQTIQLTIISILMIVQLIRYRPIRDTFSFYVALIFEILVLAVNISLLLLAIFDKSETLTFSLQQDLSYSVLILNIAIDIFGNIVMWLYVLLAIRAAYVSSKKFGLSGKTNWLSVLVIAYQSPGMDFHDLSNQEIPDSTVEKQVQVQVPTKQPATTSKKMRIHPAQPMTSLIRLDSVSPKASTIAELKGSSKVDSQTFSPNTVESPFSNSDQRLESFPFISKFEKKNVQIVSEGSSTVGSDSDGISSRRELKVIRPSSGLSKVIKRHFRLERVDMENKIPESCEEITESNASTEHGPENRFSNFYSRANSTVSTNFPRFSSEIRSTRDFRSRIISQSKVDIVDEDLKNQIPSSNEFSLRNLIRKSKITDLKSKSEKPIKISSIVFDIEKNNSEINSRESLNVGETNKSFENMGFQTTGRTLGLNNNKSMMSKFFTNRS